MMNTSSDSNFQTPVWRQVRQNNSNFIKPLFKDFQLIGDSLLVRFADQILNQPSRRRYGRRTIGYCVGGQKIDQLRKRIKCKLYPLRSKVMLLIGTNDVLCGENFQTMIKHFSRLFKLLKKTVEKLLILTLPPIPKLCVTYSHWTVIRQYNLFLKSLHNGSSVIVADICPLFTKFSGALEYKLEPYHLKCKRSRSTDKGKLEVSGKENELLTKRCSAENYVNSTSKLSALKDDVFEIEYQNTTDSNTSVESDMLISELSQEMKVLKAGKTNKKKATRNKENTVLGCFKSQLMNKVNIEYQKPGKKETLSKHADSYSKKSVFLKNGGKPNHNENLCATSAWIVETDEDSMNNLVYQSQEEVEYDSSEIKSDVNHNISSDFLKYIESTNESDMETKTLPTTTKWAKEGEENESESSSTSEEENLKWQTSPYVDSNFVHFLNERLPQTFIQDFEEVGRSESRIKKPFKRSNSWNKRGSINAIRPPTPHPHKPWCGTNNLAFAVYEDGNNTRDFSDKEQLIMKYSKEICYLEYYEIIHKFGRRRMDMVHLNFKGLECIKNFLVDNHYL